MQKISNFSAKGGSASGGKFQISEIISNFKFQISAEISNFSAGGGSASGGKFQITETISNLKFQIFCLCLCLCLCFSASPAYARSEGFFVGGGYNQPIMFTWQNQGAFSTTPGDSIKFWPAFGAFLEFGYEFKKPDWLSLSMPISWNLLKLNKNEWVHLINADAEALFHLADPEKKFDPYIGLITGFTYMTEGPVQNNSRSYGPDFGVSFGFRYSLSEYTTAGSTKTKNLSLSCEVPVKIVLFVKDRYLVDSNTATIMSIPVRIGINYKF